jgi:hypothetical protein
MSAACLTYLIILDLVILTITGLKYKSLILPVCHILRYFVASFLLDPNATLGVMLRKREKRNERKGTESKKEIKQGEMTEI